MERDQNHINGRPLPPGPSLSMYPMSGGAYQQMHHHAGSWSIRDLLVIFFKHKYKILIIFLAALMIAPLIYFQQKSIFEATSLLMVRFGREYTRPNLGVDQGQLRFGLPEILNAEISILSNRLMKESAIRKVGVARIYPELADVPESFNPVELAIPMLDTGLNMQSGKNSNLISVSFQHKDPEVAANVVNSLVDAYRERRLQILKDSKPLVLLEKKVNEYREKLDESEADLSNLKQKYKVFSFDQQRNLLLGQRMNLDVAAKAAQSQEREINQKLASLESQLKSMSKTVEAPMEENRALGEAELQLLNIERKEQELLSKYTGDNPFIANVRKEKQLVKQFVERQRKRTSQRVGGNEFYQSIQKDIVSAKAEASSLEVRQAELKKQLDGVDQEIKALDVQEKGLKDLERKVVINEQNYQTYLKRLEDVRISEDMDQQEMTSISVLQRASVPLFPMAGGKGLFYFLGVASVLGLAAGMGLAFVLEMMGQGLLSPQKAEKYLGLPVLTSIPYKKLEA